MLLPCVQIFPWSYTSSARDHHYVTISGSTVTCILIGALSCSAAAVAPLAARDIDSGSDISVKQWLATHSAGDRSLVKGLLVTSATIYWPGSCPDNQPTLKASQQLSPLVLAHLF